MESHPQQLSFLADGGGTACAAATVFTGADGRQGAAIDRLNQSLEAVLKEANAGPGVLCNPQGHVDRKHYANQLDVHYTYLCKACKTTLDAWDERLAELHNGLGRTARAFIELVRSDASTKGEVQSRGGRIFLKPYADRLGLTSPGIVKAMGPARGDFEAELISEGFLRLNQSAPVMPSSTEHAIGGVTQPRRSTPAQRTAERIKLKETVKAEQADALESILELDERSAEGVRLNSRGNVNRKYYAAQMGLSPGGLCQASMCILREWNRHVAKPSNEVSPLGQRFLSLIEADRDSETGIVATGHRIIDISHYAHALNATTEGIRASLGDRLGSLNHRLAAAGCLQTPLEKRLLAEVKSDIADGTPPKIGRAGNLHRQHYAKRLGVAATQLGTSCKDLLETLDHKYGGDSNAEMRLPEMAQWLHVRFSDGTLGLRDGKIDRKAFQEAFELRGGTFMTRYPAIRALFEEFDALAAHTKYRPAALETDILRLQNALADSPDLNKCHLRVNRPALARRLQIPVSRLVLSPFREHIDQYESRMLARAKRSRSDPFIAGRMFIFSDLAYVWPLSFLTLVGDQFKKSHDHAREKENIKSIYLGLHNLMQWVGDAANPVCQQIVSQAREAGCLDPTDWERAVLAYRDSVVGDLQQNRRSKGQANASIVAARRALAKMGPILPTLQCRLPEIKYAKALSEHRPSLAEAAPDSQSASHYIDFTNNMLRQAADRFQIDIDDNEALRFSEVLAKELQDARPLPQQLHHAILLILNQRLNGIHAAAANIIQQARSRLEEGSLLLANASIDGTSFLSEYSLAANGRQASHQLLREYFPNPRLFTGPEATLQRDQSRSNLLALAVAEFDGLLPGNGNAKASRTVGQFFSKRYNEVGTKETLAPLLNPSRDASGAALTLYLVESGANVSVGRTLELDCIEPGSDPGFSLITGFKARAKGKPIYAELASDSAAINAMEWYGRHSARYRARVDPQEAGYLFLHQVGERAQLATPHWYTNWFASFARTVPFLTETHVTPCMLRPSVLLKAALENDGRLQVGRAIGQHGAAVSQGYQEKLPIRLLRDQHMRKFQRALETRVLQNAVEIAQRFGISVEDFQRRIQELQGTGLGTFCVDPNARPGLEGQRCSTVDCWRECPQLLIVADVEAIALLQIWQHSLSAASGEWERDHPERWGEVWLPWLCLTQVVEKRMSRGALLLIWRRAQVRAVELQQQPDFVPPRPF